MRVASGASSASWATCHQEATDGSACVYPHSDRGGRGGAVAPAADDVRQADYQVVARQLTENSGGSYRAMSPALVAALKGGPVPWTWLEVGCAARATCQ